MNDFKLFMTLAMNNKRHNDPEVIKYAVALLKAVINIDIPIVI